MRIAPGQGGRQKGIELQPVAARCNEVVWAKLDVVAARLSVAGSPEPERGDPHDALDPCKQREDFVAIDRATDRPAAAVRTAAQRVEEAVDRSTGALLDRGRHHVAAKMQRGVDGDAAI